VDPHKISISRREPTPREGGKKKNGNLRERFKGKKKKMGEKCPFLRKDSANKVWGLLKRRKYDGGRQLAGKRDGSKEPGYRNF